MEYNFKQIEQNWQQRWRDQKTYKVEIDPSRPKFYVLDMFPYPSGAGLHVGHPLGYIASDIFSRYKRLCGFNVLHPMGYDAYGLPAEQYAIQTGQHPAITTEKNIARYREQLDRIGFCFDWNREVRTCEPGYYKWTQWAFSQMFNSFYCNKCQSAQPINKLVERFATKGSEGLDVACSKELSFTAAEWNAMSEKERQQTLMNYRIAYLGETMVNWCPELGTVLANDEVVNGVSERGGYPVEQKVMRQWCLRVSAYAQRLLDGLETIDWSDSIKETQKNWIGRSEGTEAQFKVVKNDNPATQDGLEFTIFTTRADTMFGVTFMVLAPESKYVQQVVTSDKKAEVEAYLEACKRKTERDRQAAHEVTGVFTGAYAVNPITGDNIPILVSEYVLAGYGTGAIMAVPAHDSRDWAFAKHFNLPIIPLIEGDYDLNEGSFDAKEGVMKNSANAEINLNGLQVKESIAAMKKYVTEKKLGRVKVNYRLRDAIFSRQRYWGEPFPIYYKEGMPYTLPAECLPLELPEVSDFKPNKNGEPPLGNADLWAWDEANKKVVSKSLIDEKTIFPLELCTMPGFAGSSAYYTRYTDPHNNEALVSEEANQYWDNVDLYLGGSEHATGHLIYSRFWNKFLKDINVVKSEEPFKKLINQGMIQGSSRFAMRVSGTNKYVSADIAEEYGQCDPIHVDVNFVNNLDMDVEAFRAWRPEFADAEVICNKDGKFLTTAAVEKMSKSKYNVVNPDDICEKYGADTLRIYEMFLGPIEQSKPWDTAGIDGAFRFLKKFWALYNAANANALNDNDNENDKPCAKVTDAEPTADNLKSLHKLIKKVTGDIEQFSYNTAISAFMVAVNELTQQKCNSKSVLEQLVVLIAPFAPHIAEELWMQLGNSTSVCDAKWPVCEEKYLIESTVKYPVQIGGKMRFTIDLPADADAEAVKAAVLATEEAQRWIAGKEILKFVFVPKKIVNIVTKG